MAVSKHAAGVFAVTHRAACGDVEVLNPFRRTSIARLKRVEYWACETAIARSFIEMPPSFAFATSRGCFLTPVVLASVVAQVWYCFSKE